jgi:hypothetical protein
MAFTAAQIANALKLSPQTQENLHCACFLYAWALVDSDRSLLRKEYYRPGKIMVRKELCSRIKDSAMKVAGELREQGVAELLSKLARLIGREEAIGDDEVALAASTIMAADMLDRVCFQSGFWDPRAAHTLLRGLKLGKVKDIHPSVLCFVVKFLAEAITSRQVRWVIPKHIRNNPELMAEAEKIRDMEVSENETKIPLADLSPGMRLSRPLVTFDGTRLLDPDVQLDQDLIWRIWQLSAVRPINAPVILAE